MRFATCLLVGATACGGGKGSDTKQTSSNLTIPTVTTDADGDGSPDDVDCAPADPSVYPGAEETWYDGVDQDCSGGSDFDQDGDGADVPADCDDLDPAVAPGASDPWGDLADQDCDGFDGAGTATSVALDLTGLHGPRLGENADGVEVAVLGDDADIPAIAIATLQYTTELLTLGVDVDTLDGVTVGSAFDLEITGTAAAPPLAWASVAIVDVDGEAHVGFVPFHGGWSYGSSDFVDPTDLDAVDVEVDGTDVRVVGCSAVDQWTYYAEDQTDALGSASWASAVSLAPGAGSACAVHGDAVALVGGDPLEEFAFDGTNALVPVATSLGPYVDVQWEPAAQMALGPAGIELLPDGGSPATSPTSSEPVRGRFDVGADGTYYVAWVDGAGAVRVSWGDPGNLVETPIATGLSAVTGVDVLAAANGTVWVAALGAEGLAVAVLAR